jgi:hypothetical protein
MGGSTAADGDRHRRQDCGEVTQGVEADIGRHAVTARAHAGHVMNTWAMGTDTIEAKTKILKEREQSGEVEM